MNKKRTYFYLFIMGFVSTIMSKAMFLIAGLFMVTFGRDRRYMMLFGTTFIISVFLYALIDVFILIYRIRRSDHPSIKLIRDSLEEHEDLLSGMQAAEIRLSGRGQIVYEPCSEADIRLTDKVDNLISEQIEKAENTDLCMFVLKINILASRVEDLRIEMDLLTMKQYDALASGDKHAIRREKVGRNSIVLADRKSSVYDDLCSWDTSEEYYDEQGPCIGVRFAGVLVSAIKNIHERGLLSDKYGKELPIMLTDALVNSYLKELNVKANGEELVESVSKGLYRD